MPKTKRPPAPQPTVTLTERPPHVVYRSGDGRESVTIEVAPSCVGVTTRDYSMPGGYPGEITMTRDQWRELVCLVERCP